MKNLANLVKSVIKYSEPGDHYDIRVHVFGRLSGILDPRGYRTVEVNFMCDLIGSLFNSHSVIDENMNHDDPNYDAERGTEVVFKLLEIFNIAMAPSTGERLSAADPDNTGLVDLDMLLQVRWVCSHDA